MGRSDDLDAFVRDMRAWAPDALGFNGFTGQMFLNQIGKRADDPRAVASLLTGVLTAPADGADAVRKIDKLAAAVRRIGVGSNPSPGYSGFLASYFWALQDRAENQDGWPIAWMSAMQFAEYCAGALPPTVDPARRYRRYLEIVTELDNDFTRFEEVAHWWKNTQPVFLDAVLVDRCRFNKQFGKGTSETRENARALGDVFDHLGKALLDPVATAAGLELKCTTPNWRSAWRSKDQSAQADMWVDWRLPVERAYPAIRVWVTHQGTIIGLRSGVGRKRPGWVTELAKIVEPLGLAEFELTWAEGSSHSSKREITGAPGEFVYGKWYERDALADLNLRAEVVSVTEQLRPALDRIVELAGDDGSVSRAVSSTSPVEATVAAEAEDFPQEAQGPPEEAEESPEEAEASLDDRIESLAEELLLEERGFLDDIVELLRDKGQVILYGPPGTGKTYLARKLARALAPDPVRRMLVQFHPSTSYEDFFEGYRPETGPGGAMAYRLIPGPLARLAERAAAAPGRRFVMVIDEINRANLPKVLGELLFLFEYRDERVQTLYRPGSHFELPENLWFIGTMNTADRSIALIDAALRRRFHFVPFFPDRGPTAGLLERWLRAEREPEWVGALVDMVNDELAEELSGSHLLLGPSHFMKKGLNRKKLRRIWEYNIEPFIEDQFFGDPARIKRFRFEAVRERFRDLGGDTAEPAEDSTVPDETERDSSAG